MRIYNCFELALVKKIRFYQQIPGLNTIVLSRDTNLDLYLFTTDADAKNTYYCCYYVNEIKAYWSFFFLNLI